MESVDERAPAAEAGPPWAWDEFYAAFERKFHFLAINANWSGSGQDDEDLEQWLWMHFLEVWDKAQEWTHKIVMVHASREIKKYAKQQRIDYEEFRCEYVYTEELVKGFLMEAAWSDADECPDVDARADITRVFPRLSKRQQQAVFGYYALGERYERGSANERALSRGVKELTYQLNAGLPRTTISLDMAADMEDM